MDPKPQETDLRVAWMGIPGATNRVSDLFERYQKYIPVEGGRKKSRRSKPRRSKPHRSKSRKSKSHKSKSNRRKSNRRKSRKK